MTAQEKNQEYLRMCQKRGAEPPSIQTIEEVFIFQCFLAGMNSEEIEPLLEMKLTNRQKDLIRVCKMLEIPLHFNKEQDADSLLQEMKNYIRQGHRKSPESEKPDKKEKQPEKTEVPIMEKQQMSEDTKDGLMMKVLQSNRFNARQLEQLKDAFQRLPYEALKSIAVPDNTAEEMRLKIEFYEIVTGNQEKEEEKKNWWEKFNK